MAQKKKSFIDNPALQFISTAETETKPPEEKTIAMPQPTGKPPEGYKVNPLYIETKSKRLQLLVQPSLLDKLKGKAKAEGRSVNDLVHSILEEALKRE